MIELQHRGNDELDAGVARDGVEDDVREGGIVCGAKLLAQGCGGFRSAGEGGQQRLAGGNSCSAAKGMVGDGEDVAACGRSRFGAVPG